MSKAKERLKEFAAFSPSVETFKQLFWDNLDKSRTDAAIDILLEYVFEMLKSEGETFNEILALADEAKAEELKSWVAQTRSKL